MIAEAVDVHYCPKCRAEEVSFDELADEMVGNPGIAAGLIRAVAGQMPHS